MLIFIHFRVSIFFSMFAFTVISSTEGIEFLFNFSTIVRYSNGDFIRAFYHYIKSLSAIHQPNFLLLCFFLSLPLCMYLFVCLFVVVGCSIRAPTMSMVFMINFLIVIECKRNSKNRIQIMKEKIQYIDKWGRIHAKLIIIYSGKLYGFLWCSQMWISGCKTNMYIVSTLFMP